MKLKLASQNIHIGSGFDCLWHSEMSPVVFSLTHTYRQSNCLNILCCIWERRSVNTSEFFFQNCKFWLFWKNTFPSCFIYLQLKNYWTCSKVSLPVDSQSRYLLKILAHIKQCSYDRKPSRTGSKQTQAVTAQGVFSSLTSGAKKLHSGRCRDNRGLHLYFHLKIKGWIKPLKPILRELLKLHKPWRSLKCRKGLYSIPNTPTDV